MIQPNEIRKGNFVLCDAVEVQVLSIEETYFISQTHEGKKVVCDYVSALPVNLTPDVFAAWGFTRKDFWWTKDTFTLYDANDHLSSSSFMFRQLIRCTRIQYLHQLQNLYHSIEGIELQHEELQVSA